MLGLEVELAGGNVFARGWHPNRNKNKKIGQNNLVEGFIMLPLLKSIV
jgi:hypothetical protein